jgi:RHS repeat-associated protein
MPLLEQLTGVRPKPAAASEGAASSYTALSAGIDHSLALLTNGTVMAWGNNVWGQLGDNTQTNRLTPVPVSGLPSPQTSEVVAVAAGEDHSVALMDNGTVRTWGSNEMGQLGNGDPVGYGNRRLTPVLVPGLTGVVAIAAGRFHSLAVLSDGTVRAWGLNNLGQVGNGTATNQPRPVVVLDSNGAALSGIVAIAGGQYHSVGLVSDGTVRAWGLNGSGQLGNGTTSNQLRAVPVSNLANVVAVAAGARHTVALRADGIALAWGDNTFGQLGDGATPVGGLRQLTPVVVVNATNLVAVAAGGNHSLGLKSDGTVWVWGSDSAGQLGDGGGVGDKRSRPIPIGNLGGIVTAIAAGEAHSLVTLIAARDGEARATGENASGQLGNGSTARVAAPVPVQGLPAASGDNTAPGAGPAGASPSIGQRSWEQLGEGNPAMAPVTVECECAKSQAPAGAGSGAHAGAPSPAHVRWGVNVTTGNFWRTSNHLQVPGRGVPLSFAHTFNKSEVGIFGSTGSGARHSYEMGLNSYDWNLQAARTSGTASAATAASPARPEFWDVRVVQENGSTVTFRPAGPPPSDLSADYTGPYVGYPGVLASLVHTRGPDGTFTNGTWTFTRFKDQIKHTFNAQGRLVSQASLDGYPTTLTYDAGGRLDRVTDPAGRYLQYYYFPGSQLVERVVDVTGNRQVSFTYIDDEVRTLTDENGGVTNFEFPSDGFIITDPRGAVLKGVVALFNPPGWVGSYFRLVSLQGPTIPGEMVEQSGGVGPPPPTTFSYTPHENLIDPRITTVTDPSGHVNRYIHDRRRLTMMIRGFGSSEPAVWRFAYDPLTMGLRSVTDPMGHTETNTYDSRGNVLTHTDALNRTHRYSYNSFNQVETTIDPLNGYTLTPHDLTFGRLQRVERILTETGQRAITHLEYDTAVGRQGDVIKVTDARGKPWSYTYDARGNVTSATDPLVHRTVFCPDAIGRVIQVVDPKGSAGYTCPATAPTVPPPYGRTYTYNAFGDPLSVTDATWRRATWEYDKNRNVTSSSDRIIAWGRSPVLTTLYEYTGRNLLSKTRRADNQTPTSTYGADGELLVQYDTTGRPTRYGYDDLGRLKTTTDPLGRVTTRRYDRAGNLTMLEDHGGTCFGQTKTGCTTFSYDAADQPSGIDYSDPATPDVTNIVYDLAGRRTSMTDGTGTSTWGWDSLHRMTSSATPGGGQVGYGYDFEGNLERLTYPGNLLVTRHFDDAGRMDWLTDWLTNRTSFAYDDNDNLRTTTGPGTVPVVDTFGYDDYVGGIGGSDRLMSVSAAKGGATLSSFTYTRTQLGSMVESVSSPPSWPSDNYGYDNIYQVTTAAGKAITYDAADNLATLPDGVTKQRFDSAHQLCWTGPGDGTCETPPAGATTYSYDTRGNRIRAGAATYGYDQARRLTSAPGATYAYNGESLRMSTTIGGATKSFAWDESGDLPMLLAETSAGASTRYIYGPDGLPLESVSPTGEVRYYHHDQLGSTRLITNKDGTEAGRSSFDVYGKPTAVSGISQPFGFAGEYTDAETGFVYLRARHYDPATGQFLTRDPIEATTREPYGYVGGNPLNEIDPWGLAGESADTKRGRQRHKELDDLQCGPNWGPGLKSGPDRPDRFYKGDPVELKSDKTSSLRGGRGQLKRYIKNFGSNKGYLISYDAKGTFTVVEVITYDAATNTFTIIPIP